MATNRDLLKEAIADAKAVKEMAIANAKATLEETFAPHLKNALSAKLQEMEELEEDDYVTELELEEKEEDMEEGVDLNELFGELNEEEEEAEEESEESEEEVSEEPIDLEDFTEDDLKKMIEDVIADMMASGELEGAGGEEELPMDAEEESEEEINLDELLAEIESLEEDDMGEYEEYEEELEEGKVWDYIKSVASGIKQSFSTEVQGWDEFQSDPKFLEFAKKYVDPKTGTPDPSKISSPEYKNDVNNLGLYYQKWLIGKFQQDPSVARKEMNDLKTKLGLIFKRGKMSGELSTDISTKLSEELDEAYSTIETLRKELNEVNLLNAKLLYTNKIFKAKTLTESQKLNVLSMFDKAKNVGEVKLVFETLSEGLKTKSTPIKENLGSASKIMGTTTPKQPIVESNDMVARFQKLAGII